MITRWTAALVCLCSLPGCSGSDPDTTKTEPAEPTEPECTVDGDCAPLLEVCEVDACVPGDRDNDLPDASPLFLSEDDERAQQGVIWPEGDVDYYAYEATGPEWISVRTRSLDGALDTVVSLIAPNGSTHAYMDDYPVWPYGVDGFDTVLYAYLPAAGTWYVAVEDITSFLDEGVSADTDYTYEVLVRRASSIGEADSAEDPGGRVDVTNGTSVWAVGAQLDPGDSDFLEIYLDFDEGQPLEIWGQYGIEGSTAEPRVTLTQGDLVLADKPDLGGDGQWLSWIPAETGTVLLEASDAAGGGPEAWFMAYVRTYEAGATHPFFGTNVYEEELEPNDTPAQALVLSIDLEADGGSPYNAFRMQGRSDRPNDSDWFEAEAEAGDRVTVKCWTDRFGSLADLSVIVLDGTGEIGRADAPDADENYVLDATVGADGPLQIAINTDAPLVGPAHWYRCAAFVFP